MKIIVEAQVALDLERYVAQNPLEFSGFGFCRREGDDLVMYDFAYLAGGSYGWTQIEPEKILALTKREDAGNARIWVHRHPLGNGKPGPHNWSSTDENTIQTAPLGGMPELIGWSASMVRTPKGWVGRIDNHLTKQTIHVEVVNELFTIINRIAAMAFGRGYAAGSYETASDDEDDWSPFDAVLEDDIEEVEDCIDEEDC